MTFFYPTHKHIIQTRYVQWSSISSGLNHDRFVVKYDERQEVEQTITRRNASLGFSLRFTHRSKGLEPQRSHR